MSPNANGPVGQKQMNRIATDVGGENRGCPAPAALAANIDGNVAALVDTDGAAAVSDYPTPAVFSKGAAFIWDADQPASSTYVKFARTLNQIGDLYRLPAYASGLLLASPCALIPPTEITTGADLAVIITDRVSVSVIKEGKLKGSRIPSADLSCMIRSEIFLGQFKPVDAVVKRPMYVGSQFDLTKPGFNDCGRGQRIYYVGDVATVVRSTEMINKFLNVMAFASNADRTNAVAAALTVMLRNYWPGAKPIYIVTSSKSHAGKDTIIEFCAGTTPKDSITYESADWALQHQFVAALKLSPDVGLINVENVRLDGRTREFRSAFLERIIMDPEPTLFAAGSGTGKAVKRTNNLVLAMSTNDGCVSDDLMNRGMRTHLTPVGDIATRTSPIGNPKLEYLPKYRDRIEAELHGMIEAWRQAGMPVDESVRHPFSGWARVIGGILMVNGVKDFLANYGVRKTVDEPVRKALGFLGAYRPAEWLSATDWAPLVACLGLTNDLIPYADRETAASRKRGLGGRPQRPRRGDLRGPE